MTKQIQIDIFYETLLQQQQQQQLNTI